MVRIDGVAVAEEAQLRRLAERIEADLATIAPGVDIRFRRVADDLVWRYADGGGLADGLSLTASCRGSDEAAEAFVVHLLVQIVDNAMPTEQPWPVCSLDPHHLLDPILERGTAQWACARHARVRVPVGRLAEHLPS